MADMNKKIFAAWMKKLAERCNKLLTKEDLKGFYERFKTKNADEFSGAVSNFLVHAPARAKFPTTAEFSKYIPQPKLRQETITDSKRNTERYRRIKELAEKRFQGMSDEEYRKEREEVYKSFSGIGP